MNFTNEKEKKWEFDMEGILITRELREAIPFLIPMAMLVVFFGIIAFIIWRQDKTAKKRQ
ncbi:MAG: hypothetical protein AB1567_10780 [bacterium]